MPVTKTRMDDRLRNWGRYWRDHDGSFKNGHCRSIEHRYLPEPGAGGAFLADERQARVAIPPDVDDAHLVNDAWKRCSRKTKEILKRLYCFGPPERRNRDELCRQCGIRREPESVYDLAVWKATKEIERTLDTPSFLTIIAGNSSSSAALRPPVSSETERPWRGSVTPHDTEDVD